jgi:hypothetical protein
MVDCSGERDEATEATPAMIEAGVAVLWDSGRLSYEAPGSDDLLIAEIWAAMMRAQGGPLQSNEGLGTEAQTMTE